MDIQSIIDYCSEKAETKQDFPFDETTLVFKVGAKMFALLSLTEPHYLNLKCDPLTALELRKKYKAVTAGYHMHKKHWNTVNLDGTISEFLIREWIDQSYQLVVQSMSKAERIKLSLV